MEKVVAFVKKETVLTVAWVLAVISSFIIKPDKEYIGYIDFKSLCTLWSLMIVVAGLTKEGLFDRIGAFLLHRTTYVWQLLALLVFLPFVFAMFITNDVALLTFVPFSMHILKMSGRKRMIIPVVAYQTLAANLGSMLTPIGNPQNIYLFGLSGMDVSDFILLMLPYTCLSALLLMAGIMTIKGKRRRVFEDDEREKSAIAEEQKGTIVKENEAKNIAAGIGESSDIRSDGRADHNNNGYTVVYGILFVLAVLSVAFPRTIRYPFVVILVLIACLIMDRKVITSIDYALLFTFVGFFIFTGNLGRIEVVRNYMISLVKGHEIMAGIISSQFISNVPAALLLSEFTTKISNLIIGVNLGGLGTLIASMASLISFKLLAHNYNELKGRYLIYFTVASVVFLMILLLLQIA